jgi:rhamnose utilization protein RhaD (predicted bifunctional aldolase and dehydrogenase)
MIDDSILNEYTLLCQTFGACFHRVQGPGGNISIKENDEIIIKASGVSLHDTTVTSGYVICNLPLLQKIYNKQSDDVFPCVLRGDRSKQPSMECFFHLLPFRVIVHIHPTKLLSVLCNEEKINTLKRRFPNALFVPYQKPGLQLANYIFKSFQGQPILFLENHGLILCSNKEDALTDIATLFDTIEKEIESPYSSVLQEIQYVRQFSERYLLKPSYSLKPHNIPQTFPALTPDQVLFLKEGPFYSRDTQGIIDVNKYSILIDKDFVYCIGKSLSHCRWIEEILLSYLSIYQSAYLPLKTLTEREKNALFDSKQEQYRLATK